MIVPVASLYNPRRCRFRGRPPGGVFFGGAGATGSPEASAGAAPGEEMGPAV
jgi:hypothetical protein